MAPPPRAGQRERGLVLPLVAIVLVTLLTFTSIALDLGLQRVGRRDMQAVADVVALDLSRLLDGSTANALRDPVRDAAATSATRNDHQITASAVDVVFGDAADDCKGDGGISGNCLTVELGTVTPDRVFTPLTAPCNSSTAATCIPTAVRVWAGSDVEYVFRPGSGDVHRSAVGRQDAIAEFEVGSFLASLTPFQQGLLNQLFARFGLNALNANVLSYSGVAGGQLTAGNIAAAISTLHPSGGASTTVTRREYLLIAAEAAELGGDLAHAQALRAAATDPAAQTTLNAPTTLTLGQIADAYLQGASAVGGGNVSLPGFLATGLLLMNGTSTVSVPDTTFSLPGLGTVAVDLSVINAPVRARGRVGVSATNTQLELRIRPQFTFSEQASFDLNTCLALDAGLLGLVGGATTCLTAGLRVVGVDLSTTAEIVVRAARAQGTLSGIDCSLTPGITVTPTILEAASVSTSVSMQLGVRLLGQSYPNAARIVLNPMTAGATGSGAPQQFDDPSEFHIPRTVGASPLGLTNLVNLTTPSLTVFGTPLPASNLILPRLQAIVTNRLTPALQRIDNLLTGPLTQILGLSLGGADLTALDRDCDAVQLVG